MKYAYAVMDGNEAPDTNRFAHSCHSSLGAAKKESEKMNKKNPNYHYYVVEWGASRWAKERANNRHPEGLV